MKFYLRSVALFLACVGVASFVASNVTGCAALGKHSAVVELAVSQAAMRYIEEAPAAKRVERARKVLGVIAKVRAVAGTEGVTVAQLAEFALQSVSGDLSPADRALALSVINIASQELRNQLGEEILSASDLTQVLGVINSIENAARIYTGT